MLWIKLPGREHEYYPSGAAACRLERRMKRCAKDDLDPGSRADCWRVAHGLMDVNGGVVTVTDLGRKAVAQYREDQVASRTQRAMVWREVLKAAPGMSTHGMDREALEFSGTVMGVPCRVRCESSRWWNCVKVWWGDDIGAKGWSSDNFCGDRFSMSRSKRVFKRMQRAQKDVFVAWRLSGKGGGL